MLSHPVARQEHIARWRVSGLSRAAYCRQHGIVYHTTRSWNRSADAPDPPQPAGSGFIEVLRPPAVISPLPLGSMATVSWPTGATLRIPTGVDPQWIGRLIAAVRPC
jgi:hypothetical protein